jgi:hypothetical protein
MTAIKTRVARWFISNPKSQFGKILEGLGMENVGIVHVHSEYFTAIWYILWLFENLVATVLV